MDAATLAKVDTALMAGYAAQMLASGKGLLPEARDRARDT